MTAARVPGDLVEYDTGEQPEGRGTGAPMLTRTGPARTGPGGTGATGVSWHADKSNEVA
jgi:hypothetical protein